MKFFTGCLLVVLLLGETAFAGSAAVNPNASGFSAQDPGEQQQSSSTPLTLDDCIGMLLDQNPDLSAAKWNERASESRLDVASRARFPVMTADVGHQYFSDAQRLVQARYNGEPGDFDRTLYRGDLTVRLPLYTSGRISNEIKAAEFLLEGLRDRSVATRDQLIFTAKSLFYSILAQEDLINSLEFSLKALQQQRTTIEQMMLVRKAARVDLLRIEVRIANLEQSIVEEQNRLTVLKRTLGNLMGMRRPDTLSVQGSLALDTRVFNKDTLLKKAYAQRSDLRAIRAEMQAQGIRISVAKADYLPQVALLASYGIRRSGNHHETSGAQSTEDVGFWGISISMPVFDMKIPARVSEERARQHSLEDQVRKVELQVGLDVETDILDLTSSMQRVRTNEKAVEQAKESLRIEQQKYSFAKGSITDVLDAQSALLQAETNYYRALADYQTARARLELSTGGSL